MPRRDEEPSLRHGTLRAPESTIGQSLQGWSKRSRPPPEGLDDARDGEIEIEIDGHWLFSFSCVARAKCSSLSARPSHRVRCAESHAAAVANAFFSRVQVRTRPFLRVRTSPFSWRSTAKYRDEPLYPFATPARPPAERWGKVPKVYVFTKRDQAISPTLQQAMTEGVTFVKTVTLDTSHSPFLSDPELVKATLMGL